MRERTLEREVIFLAPLLDALHPESRDYVLINCIVRLKHRIYGLQSTFHMLRSVLHFLIRKVLELRGLIVLAKCDPDTFNLALLRLLLFLHIKTIF